MRITQCRLKGRVTEIHLNFLQGIALMQQQRCTGVAQIVKTDFLETVPLDKAAKTIADPLGGEQTAVCQCKDESRRCGRSNRPRACGFPPSIADA